MRLFIASPVILYDYPVIKADFEGILHGKWVEESQLHLTWVFLGEVENPAHTIEMFHMLTPIAEETKIHGLGYFGKPPRILYAKAASTLLYNKARELKDSGFSLYRFKPHITLCRIKHISDYKSYKEKLKTYKEKSLGTILPEIHLYQSRLTPSGSVYSILA